MSWKICLGDPRKYWIFLSVKEWELWTRWKRWSNCENAQVLNHRCKIK